MKGKPCKNEIKHKLVQENFWKDTFHSLQCNMLCFNLKTRRTYIPFSPVQKNINPQVIPAEQEKVRLHLLRDNRVPWVTHINHIPAKCLAGSFCEFSVLGDSQCLTGQGPEQWHANLRLTFLSEGWSRSPLIPANLTCCRIL